MKTKILLAGSMLAFSGMLFTTQGNTADAATKDLTRIERPTWVSQSGMTRGEDQDRQDLGVVLPKGSKLKIRNTSDKSTYPTATLSLFNTDRNKEKTIKVTNQWQTIEITDTSVPFMSTPFANGQLQIDFEVEGASSQLPIYQKGDNQANFLNSWKSSNAGFALIKGTKFQLLVPVSDRDKLNNIPDFKSLDDYIDYQDSIIQFYDNYMGLNQVGVNQEPKNRYFLKLDTSAGVGVAGYYNPSMTADNEPSVISGWMKKANWMTLHEIGHGYQPGYNMRSDGDTMYTGEVSNNFLGNSFLATHFGKSEVENNWLYDYGHKAQVESNLYNQLINQNVPYSKLSDHRDRLIVFTDLIQSADLSLWTQFNTWYREAVNNNDSYAKNTKLPDLLNKFYSEKTGRDYTSAFNAFGIELKDNNQIHANSQYQAVSPVAKVVPDNMISQVVQSLNTPISDSMFNLVSNDQLKAFNLKGDLNINIDTTKLDELKGHYLVLKSGNSIVAQHKITDSTVNFKDVPNGAYSVAISDLPNDVKIDSSFVYVKNSTNTANLKVVDNHASALMSEPIVLRGISDLQVATVTPDFNKQELAIDITSRSPHYYFDKYAEIKVYDTNNNVVYDKVINGKSMSLSLDTVHFEVGYKIEINHEETATRLKSSNVSNLIDTSSKQNTFIIRDGYLENAKTHVNGVEESINQALASIKLVDNPSNAAKWAITSTINLLPEPKRSELLNANKDLLTIIPFHVEPQYSQSFELKDNADNTFASIKANSDSNEYVLVTNKVDNAKLNSYIEIRDTNNNVVYSNLISAMTANEEQQLDLHEGYTIKVTQPDDYSLNNSDIKGTFSINVATNELSLVKPVQEDTNSSTDTTNQENEQEVEVKQPLSDAILDEINTIDNLKDTNKTSTATQKSKDIVRQIAQENPSNVKSLLKKYDLYDTNVINDSVILLGRLNAPIATISTDYKSNKLTVAVNANRTRSTSTIEVYNKSGKLVYSKTINGNDVVKESKQFKLSSDYTIKVSSNSIKNSYDSLNSKTKSQTFTIKNKFLNK